MAAQSISHLLTVAFVLYLLNFEDVTSSPPNLRPIIGILSQEYWDDRGSTEPNGSYIAASYVKAVESAGARVVPVFIGEQPSYYEHVVNSVNGILLPGGGVDFWAKGGYGEAARTLYNLAIKVNENGIHFPLYGVCLGFEALALVSGNMEKDVLESVNGTNQIPLPLDFKSDYKTSALFSRTPPQIIWLLKKKKITSNHHSKCFTEESLAAHNLTDTWKVLTTSQVGKHGKRFISSMEHRRHPQIFGTQFHPEKPAFEWRKSGNDDHSEESIRANRWFLDYFVEQARLNRNELPEEDLRRKLIYNFQPIYTGEIDQKGEPKRQLQSFYIGFEQIYRFNNRSSDANNGHRI